MKGGGPFRVHRKDNKVTEPEKYSPDPYEDELEDVDTQPIPGLGDPEEEKTEGIVCMPADLVDEK